MKLLRKQLPHEARSPKGKKKTAFKICLVSIIGLVSVLALPTTASETTAKTIVVTHTVDDNGNTVTIITRGGKR
jgi:hypothetical protein